MFNFANLVEIPLKSAMDFPDRVSHKIRIGNSFIEKTYKDLANEHAKVDMEVLTDLSERSVEEVIAYIVAFHIDFHRQLLSLNFEFHCKYHRCFDLHQWIYEVNNLAENSTDMLKHIIDDQSPTTSGLLLSDRAFIILRILASIMMDILDERPRMIQEPDIEDTLVRMCVSVLR